MISAGPISTVQKSLEASYRTYVRFFTPSKHTTLSSSKPCINSLEAFSTYASQRAGPALSLSPRGKLQQQQGQQRQRQQQQELQRQQYADRDSDNND